MANIGMDVPVEELRQQFRDAVEKLAEQRAELDQATQEVTRLREELETTQLWAENFAHTAADNGAARDRYKKELKETRNATEPFNATSRKLCYEENEKLRGELRDVKMEVKGVRARADRFEYEHKEAYKEIDKLKAALEESNYLLHEAGVSLDESHAWREQLTEERDRFREGLETVHKELTRIQANYAKSGTKSVTCLAAGSHLRHLSHLCVKARQSLSQTVIPKKEGEKKPNPPAPGYVMCSIRDLEELFEAYWQNKPSIPTKTQIMMLEDMLREAILTAKRIDPRPTPQDVCSECGGSRKVTRENSAMPNEINKFSFPCPKCTNPQGDE